jgi:hypothetical protein
MTTYSLIEKGNDSYDMRPFAWEIDGKKASKEEFKAMRAKAKSVKHHTWQCGGVRHYQTIITCED